MGDKDGEMSSAANKTDLGNQRCGGDGLAVVGAAAVQVLHRAHHNVEGGSKCFTVICSVLVVVQMLTERGVCRDHHGEDVLHARVPAGRPQAQAHRGQRWTTIVCSTMDPVSHFPVQRHHNRTSFSRVHERPHS